MNIKHVGKLKVTGRRLIVITSKIPGREDHALIVDTDSLRDTYLNSLMDAVTSREAQEAQDLGTVLARIPSPEQGVSYLKSLHSNNYLTPVPIKDVIMLPNNASPIPLEYVIKLMEGESVQNVMRLMEGEEIKKYEDDTLHGFANQQKTEQKANKEAIAFNILAEADRLQKDSDRKREEAYKIAPHLRPKEITEKSMEEQMGYDPRDSISVTMDVPSFSTIMEEVEIKPKRTRTRKKSQ